MRKRKSVELFKEKKKVYLCSVRPNSKQHIKLGNIFLKEDSKKALPELAPEEFSELRGIEYIHPSLSTELRLFDSTRTEYIKTFININHWIF